MFAFGGNNCIQRIWGMADKRFMKRRAFNGVHRRELATRWARSLGYCNLFVYFDMPLML